MAHPSTTFAQTENTDTPTHIAVALTTANQCRKMRNAHKASLRCLACLNFGTGSWLFEIPSTSAATETRRNCRSCCNSTIGLTRALYTPRWPSYRSLGSDTASQRLGLPRDPMKCHCPFEEAEAYSAHPGLD